MSDTHIESNRFSLYKVLPEQYVTPLLEGKILFRNLVYFISREGGPRTDLYEGRHVDAPDHPVSLFFENGRQVSDCLEFHNSTKYPERIFCFCTSMCHGPEHAKFGDGCVKFNNPAALRKGLNAALARKHRLSRLARRHQLSGLEYPFLIARPVLYYKTTGPAPADLDITDPRQLPFVKRILYSDEAEFRFLFAERGGYDLERKIATKQYSISEEITNRPEAQITINIGSIWDIAERIK